MSKIARVHFGVLNLAHSYTIFSLEIDIRERLGRGLEEEEERYVILIAFDS